MQEIETHVVSVGNLWNIIRIISLMKKENIGSIERISILAPNFVDHLDTETRAKEHTDY